MVPIVAALLFACGLVCAADAAPTVLDISNFRDQTESHELSYVFFYTKKGKDWETPLATFAEGAALLQEAYPQILCATVDLDGENSPLTLYTKYNSVDLMIFYPDFVATPLRFHGTFSPAGMLETAHRYIQYTTTHLHSWADPKALVEDFMAIKFKGKTDRGNLSTVVDQAAFHAKKISVYVDYLEKLKGDVANLVEESNELRFQLHNSKHLEVRNPETGEFDNEEAFLDQKMRMTYADDFLQHLFPKRKLPKVGQGASEFLKKKEEARKAQMVLDAAAEAREAAAELM